MENLRFDLTKREGKFKILNATNGGPMYKRHATEQFRSNYTTYKEVGFPYTRNHDSGVCAAFGGPFSHDVTHIFPCFDADPYAPESYDFACTDEDILKAVEVGTKTFFRLGETIEHQIKKHATLPPKDFKKWAVICEHIIRHYNEGWANGFELNIEYWEIWNEPNYAPEDSDNKCTWGGTNAQFFDFYEIAAKHLKKCFPNLKIGGPAYAGNEKLGEEKWADEFLFEMRKRNVEIDFFSWHQYENMPEKIIALGESLKKLLIKHGYEKAESICNEWNYVKGWTDEFVYSLEVIHGLKDASFIIAMMSLAQRSSVDMLMYYDTRPGVFNGIFDFYTLRPLKGYYPMKWYSDFYKMDSEVRPEKELEGIYSLCGIDKAGKILSVITHYTDDDNATDKEISIDFGRKGKYEIYLLDSEHNGELVKITDELSFTMPVHSCIMIKEI